MSTWVDRQWEVLGSGLEGRESRESLYRLVEEVCLAGYGPNLYEKIALKLLASAQAKVNAVSSSSSSFLEEMAMAFEAHLKETMAIRSVCLYLDRSIEGCPGLKQVGSLAFRRALQIENGDLETAVVAELRQLAGRALAGTIEEGHIYQAAKRCAVMLQELGIYEELLEPWLISEAIESYAAQGRRLESLDSGDVKNDAIIYTKGVMSALERANAAVEYIFQKGSTSRKLGTAIEQQLILPYASSVLFEALPVLDIETIKSLYTLIKRVHQEVKAHLAAKQLAYTRACETLAKGTPQQKDKVVHLLQLRTNLSTLFLEALTLDDDDPNWVTAVLKDAFEEALNQDAQSVMVAEILACFFSANDTTEAELEAAMPLFQCCRSKDIFESFYRRELACRLIEAQHTHASILPPRREKYVISRLQKECGTSYVAKLEGMCKDLELNADIIKEYAKEESSGLGLMPLVLTTNYWPSSQAGEKNQVSSPLKLPAALKVQKDHFAHFYSKSFRGRRLKWQHDLDRCHLLASYHTSGQTYLDTSMTQALVLLALSGKKSLSMTALSRSTGIQEQMQPVLASLQAAGLIRLLNESTVAATTAFSSQTPHFRLPLPDEPAGTGLSRFGLADRAKVIHAVTRDRQYAIDAAIVRVMKARKTLSHSLLLTDVLAALKHPASSADIKPRIESLIEREYLERDLHEQNCYNYLA